MTVNISKPAVNVREKLAELDKPTGIAGEAMLRAETPQEQFNLIGAGRRNLIINGGFDVWQRGTSFGASPGYTADRWWAQSNHTGSTVTQEEFTVGQTEVPNSPRYFLRSALTYQTTAGDRIAWAHKIEDWRGLVNQTLTISGWYRRTAVIYGTGLQLIMKESSSFYDSSGLAASPATDDVFPITSEWKPFKYTFFVPSSIVGTMTSSASFDIRLYYQTCYQAGNFDLANVQLEYGNTATPFEHRSYGEELALCQRYYQVLIDAAAGQRPVAAARANSTSTLEFHLPLTVGMRDITSLPQSNMGTVYIYTDSARVNTTSATIVLNDDYRVGSSYAYLRITGASVADDRAYTIAGYEASAFLAVDGEL